MFSFLPGHDALDRYRKRFCLSIPRASARVIAQDEVWRVAPLKRPRDLQQERFPYPKHVPRTKCDEQENRMIRLIGLWLVWGAPYASRQSRRTKTCMMAPRPSSSLTVKPQPQHSVQPNTVCDFEHQCYPGEGWTRGLGSRRLPRPLWSSPPRPRPQVPDEPVAAPRGETVWTEPCRPTRSRTTSMPWQMATGSCQAAKVGGAGW